MKKPSVRHQKIIEWVQLQGYISTEELVSRLNVSPQTVRRDLNDLAERDLIRRHHGGAAQPSSAENADYLERKQFFSKQKTDIAQAVAAMIPNGASLFIDIGTTPEAVAHALLGRQKLRIVTNNLNAAHLLRQNDSFDITMAGGSLRKDGGIIGEATCSFIAQFRLDFGILGISAIDSDGSLLDYDYHEVQVKRAIMQSARQTVLVADHSKFSRHAMVRLAALTDFDCFFTDHAVPPAIFNLLQDSQTLLKICSGETL